MCKLCFCLFTMECWKMTSFRDVALLADMCTQAAIWYIFYLYVSKVRIFRWALAKIQIRTLAIAHQRHIRTYVGYVCPYTYICMLTYACAYTIVFITTHLEWKFPPVYVHTVRAYTVWIMYALMYRALWIS